MSKENSSLCESDKDQNSFHSEQKENDCNKETDKYKCDDILTNLRSSEKNNTTKNNIENEECLKDDEKITNDDCSTKKTSLLQEIDELDIQSICEKLRNMPEDELLENLKEIESTNFSLQKENEAYDFILNDDEAFQRCLGSIKEVDKDTPASESIELTYPIKCYFVKQILECTEKTFKLENDLLAHKLQYSNFELQSLNISLKNLNESKEKFDKNIRIEGRHPVTKKIILQKVAKYFDDTIRIKMDLINRYKTQIQSDIMEQNKILSQTKAQKQRLAFLDLAEFQEAQFEYKKSCKELAICKEQLGKCKPKFNLVLQTIGKLKKDLEKEENVMEEMINSVTKLEHLEEVMLKEEDRNDEKVSELKASMRKIKLDPRRHDLPEVFDYAVAKRENVVLMKNLNKWKKKVEAIQQEKLLYLDALKKKSRY